MKTLDIETLNNKIQDLIQKVEKLANKKIKIEYDDSTVDDYIYLSQSKHVENADEIVITIEKSPEVNYMISHELFHIILNYQNYSKLSFLLFSENPSFNNQEQATAESLKGILDHRIIGKWEIDEGFRSETVQNSLDMGTKELLLAKEIDASDNQLVLYRMLLMLDNYSEEIAQLKNYDASKKVAEAINSHIGNVENKLQYHHVLTEMFTEFDKEIQGLGYVNLNHQKLVTVTPVFSNRQLRLATNQVVEILHSDYKTKNKKDAYNIQLKNNEQNVGVFELSKQQKEPKYFQELYQMKLEDFLAEFKIEYLIR